MRRRYVVIGLILLMGAVVAGIPVGSVSPHGGYTAKTKLCRSCHRLHSLVEGALAEASVAELCISCHPDLKTHIYPSCAVCHEPHAKTTNLSLVRQIIQGHPVTFLARTGKDSFADGVSAQAVCEVCHTKTAYHSPMARKTHYDGEDCTRCHPHSNGFTPSPSCTTCHGYPPSTGAHKTHTKASYGPRVKTCRACHRRVTTWIVHRNGKVEFRDGRSFSRTKVCNKCHGTEDGIAEAKANWKKRIRISDCLYCHNSASPASSEYDGGGVRAPAKDAYWTSRGHGSTRTYPVSGNPGAKLACTACHDRDASHISHKLGDTDRLSTTGDALCSGCHGAGGSATKKVSTHGNLAYSVRTQAPFAKKCADCHDPHGTTNIYMINPSIGSQTVVFTAKTGADSYDESDPEGSNKDDLCATCHTATAHNRVPNNQATNPHNEGLDCTICHAHDGDGDPATVDGFMPVGGCTVCHGQPPPPAASAYTTFDEERTPHLKHAGSQAGQYGFACTKCHDDTNPAYGGHTTTPPTFQDVFFNGAAPANPNGTYNRTSYTCVNLYCHSNGDPAGGQMAYANPIWGEDRHLACNGCHGDVSSLNTNSHRAHLTTRYSDRGARSIGCYECHASTAQDDDNEAIGTLANHVNGAKDVAIDESDVMGRTGQPTFTAERTCTNVYCHSDGVASRETPGQPTFATPMWGQPSTGICGTCHAVTPTTLTTGAHTTHFDTTRGPGLTSCDACHASYGASTHADGRVQFADGNILSTTSVCNSCHSPDGPVDGVAQARANWATAARVSCEGCHDGGTSTIQGVSAPDVVGDNTSYGFNVTGHGGRGLNCLSCHDQSAPHFDGQPHTYSASADNYVSGFRLRSGSLNIPLTGGETYAQGNFSLCYQCHPESRLVGLPENYSNALFTHQSPPPAGYPIRVATIGTNFRNELAAGFNLGNVPANIHWDHLDMVMVNWDSDGDRTFDSYPSCPACHDPHGVKSFANGTNYPAMTYADMAITHGRDANGDFGQIGSTAYTARCFVCHAQGGEKYYFSVAPTATPQPPTATPTPPPASPTATLTPPPATATPVLPTPTSTLAPSTATPTPGPSTVTPTAMPATATPTPTSTLLPSTATPTLWPPTVTPTAARARPIFVGAVPCAGPPQGNHKGLPLQIWDAPRGSAALTKRT